MEMYGKIGEHAEDPRNKTKRGAKDILEDKASVHDILMLQWPEQGREEEIFYADLGKSEYYQARRKHGHNKEVLAFEDRATGKPLIFRGFNLRTCQKSPG